MDQVLAPLHICKCKEWNLLINTKFHKEKILCALPTVINLLLESNSIFRTLQVERKDILVLSKLQLNEYYKYALRCIFSKDKPSFLLAIASITVVYNIQEGPS